MAVLSDSIEQFIKSLFDDIDNRIELQRNELAQHFGCAPSQINYVLNTRFSPEKGYIVKSKRGGGGYILIMKMMPDQHEYIIEMLRCIESAGGATEKEAFNIADRLYNFGIIGNDKRKLMKAATSDKAICIPLKVKDKIRGGILKEMLFTLMEEESL